MKEVNHKANFLRMGTESLAYLKRIDLAVDEVQQMINFGLISSAEALSTFNRKMGC